jgi:hypothetical protein
LQRGTRKRQAALAVRGCRRPAFVQILKMALKPMISKRALTVVLVCGTGSGQPRPVLARWTDRVVLAPSPRACLASPVLIGFSPMMATGDKLRRRVATAAALCALGCASAQGASISYYLNQSNALPDNVNYLKVTVSDDGLAAPNTIYFRVEILSPLLDIAGTNFGIQRFAFNSAIDPIDVAYRV